MEQDSKGDGSFLFKLSTARCLNSSLYFKPGAYINHNAPCTLSDVTYGAALLKTLTSCILYDRVWSFSCMLTSL